MNYIGNEIRIGIKKKLFLRKSESKLDDIAFLYSKI